MIYALAATGGGSLPLEILSFSFRVFKLHGGNERGCKMSLEKF